jgi:predicted permease
LLFGLAPALRSTAVDPAAHLRPGSSRVRTWQPTMRRVLVVTQVAFSVVLVALAGLFSRSLSELRSVDLGFHNQSVVVFSLDFPNWWKPEARHSAYVRFLDRVKNLPGVALVSYGFPGPFRGGSSSRTMRVPGSAATAEPAWISVQSIAPRFFETIGSPVLAGREFNLSDTGSAQIALVNQAFVRQFLGGDTNPLNRVISFDDSKPVSHIAGIVPDIPHNALREKPVPTVYLPYSKNLSDGPDILLRTNGPGTAVLPVLRREVSQLGTQVTVTEPKTIRQRIDESILEDRLLATLGGFFGALALLLAAIGLYGVVAYGTVRRMGEIGIRVALGARRGAVVWMVLRDALLLVAVGLAIGLPFAMAAARAVGSMLFGIRPVDPAAFLLTGTVLAVAGVAAALLPARRAATVDPARVLRHE